MVYHFSLLIASTNIKKKPKDTCINSILMFDVWFGNTFDCIIMCICNISKNINRSITIIQVSKSMYIFGMLIPDNIVLFWNIYFDVQISYLCSHFSLLKFHISYMAHYVTNNICDWLLLSLSIAILKYKSSMHLCYKIYICQHQYHF